MEYTKYEKARIIGSRALQISGGAPFLIELSKDDLQRLRYNPVEIAKVEFERGVIPITVKRPEPGARNYKESGIRHPAHAYASGSDEDASFDDESESGEEE